MTKPCLLITLPILHSRAGNELNCYDILVSDGPEDLQDVVARDGTKINVIYCSGLEPLDEALLAGMPNLRLIVVCAAGLDGIDLKYTRSRGIVVANADGLNADDVADHTMALFLGFRREIVANHLYVREGRWVKEGHRPLVPSIVDERAGIVGMGHIGQALAKRLEPFGPEIRWWGPNPKPDITYEQMPTLAELASWSTVLFIAARSGPDTDGLISREILEALGPEGLLVNVSRGFLVDEPAMVELLGNGGLGGAALDVFTKEPFDGASMAGLSNVLLAPHVAGGTIDGFAKVEKLAWQNLKDFAAGKPVTSPV